MTPIPETRVIELVLKLQPFATEDARYKVAHGGRGGAKSWTVAAILLLKGTEEKLRILCAREIQKSIKASVHQLLKDTIFRLGLEDFYDIKDERIVGQNGTQFLFCGLHRNVSQIKSFEGIDIVWIEEGESISRSSWDTLTPTIRKPGSEIWVTMNPKREDAPLYQLFIDPDKERPPRSLVIEINYYDNPYFPEVLEEERAHCQATDRDLYEHIWLGQPERHSNAQIFHDKWVVTDFPTPPDDGSTMFYYGIDWGFGPNPCAFAKCWIFKGSLYIRVKHVYQAEMEDLEEHLVEWDPGTKEWPLRADPEDTSAIRYIKNRGFKVKKASKPAGSVKAGIRFLRSFNTIYIHVDDVKMQEEARLYKYKVDPVTEEILDIILKAYDHGWDAVRYALSLLINKGVKLHEHS